MAHDSGFHGFLMFAVPVVLVTFCMVILPVWLIAISQRKGE